MPEAVSLELWQRGVGGGLPGKVTRDGGSSWGRGRLPALEWTPPLSLVSDMSVLHNILFKKSNLLVKVILMTNKK